MNRTTRSMLTLGLLLASVSCYAAEPNTGQAREIAEIKNLGGRVFFDEESPGKPVIAVSLENTKATDAALTNLEGLIELENLDLERTEVGDAGLTHLRGLARLESLNLRNTRVTDAGLVRLKTLTRIRLLYLDQTKVTDVGLVHLNGLTKLQELDLRQINVTDAGMEELEKAFPNCKILP